MERGRRRRRCQTQNANTTASFGAKNVMVTLGVVCLACSMLQYNSRNSQAKKELKILANSVEDITKQLNIIQNNYQILEDKFAICSQEMPKLEKQMAAFEALAEILEANRVRCNPRIHPSLPYVDVKLVGVKPVQVVSIKNVTDANSTNDLLSEFEQEVI